MHAGYLVHLDWAKLSFAFRVVWPSSRRAETKASVVAAAPAPAVPLSEARQIADRGFAMSVDNYDSTLDDFTTAEALLKRALTLDSSDGEIWAQVQGERWRVSSRQLLASGQRIRVLSLHGLTLEVQIEPPTKTQGASP